jgi:hypothetical protein
MERTVDLLNCDGYLLQDSERDALAWRCPGHERTLPGQDSCVLLAKAIRTYISGKYFFQPEISVSVALSAKLEFKAKVLVVKCWL